MSLKGFEEVGAFASVTHGRELYVDAADTAAGVQRSRRRTHHTAATISTAASATKIPSSMTWNVQ